MAKLNSCETTMKRLSKRLEAAARLAKKQCKDRDCRSDADYAAAWMSQARGYIDEGNCRKAVKAILEGARSLGIAEGTIYSDGWE